MFKNMKIEINEAQPLDDVNAELCRLGYSCNNYYVYDISNLKCGVINSVATYDNGEFSLLGISDVDLIYGCELTTFQQLKEMK